MAEMEETEARLISGLREAVAALYGCRYSEQPLAERLDALLKEVTGKTNADITHEKVMNDPELRAALAKLCRMPSLPSPPTKE